jgi:putative DNA methylase
MTTTPRKKLIEVALPLEEINKASAREKQIKTGKPLQLHHYWARRPLATSRAVIFSQLVDDPISWPSRFSTLEAQADERKRLHDLIIRMVAWEASNNESILNEARFEIARSVAWGRNEEPPTEPSDVLAYLYQHAPPVFDPFCGGGSIPLEAQRLGLRAYGSDLNPVAVLISKALIELPPKFAGQRPVNSATRAQQDLIGRDWKGATGLAEDVRYYGRWLRDEAEKRCPEIYPKALLPDGSEAVVVAWIWARTVQSPDPSAKGQHVPLVSTFLLSNKKGRKAWIEPVVDRPSGRYEFKVVTGVPSADVEEKARRGTKSGSGGQFRCLLTGSPISADWIRNEGRAKRLGAVLMAIVADSQSGRVYLSSNPQHEGAARVEEGAWRPVEEMHPQALGFRVPNYGITSWGDIFTDRQLLALSTLVDLLPKVRELIIAEGRAAGRGEDSTRLSEDGIQAVAYADAVTTYLAMAIDRLVDWNNTCSRWENNVEVPQQLFARQAIPMSWDYAEANPYGHATGSLTATLENMRRAFEGLGSISRLAGSVSLIDAASNGYPVRPVAICTDPPYFDNIGYADLSDLFYVWLRRSLGERDGGTGVWPDLFRRLLTPKAEELVATPFRHGGKSEAEAFFMNGMRRALKAMHDAADAEVPLTIYYAFKQSELEDGGLTSPGWSSFLQAVVDAGLALDGTWPVRTELGNRMRGLASNALASSIVLVCRKRTANAPATERDEFKRAVRRELPDALAKIRAAGVGPVDMAQAAIGPGMGVFTRYSAVLEASGEAMQVKDALKLINEVRDEIEDEGDYDLETRFAVEWFAEAQWEAKESGRAILLANAKNLAESQLLRAGIIDAHAGKTRLRRRDEIGPAYNPADDKTPTVWEHAQALAYALETGGQDVAASLFARLNNTEAVRALAYRLYGLCERKGWSAEALVWNRLADEWRRIEDLAASAPPPIATREGDLFGGAS